MKTFEKRILPLLTIVILLSIWIVIPCHSATLRVLEQRPLGKYSRVDYAVHAGEDTVMFLSDSGLYVQGSRDEEWRKLIDCAPAEEQAPFTAGKGDTLSRLISPTGLWQYATASGNQILIYDRFCGRLFRLTQARDGSFYLTKCDRRKGEDLFSTVNVQNGSAVYALYGNDTKKKIVIQRVDGDDYRRLFRMSEMLVRLRDSVGLYDMTLGIPAMDPQDSTLWLAIEGYPFVYIIDMDGHLRDSARITNSDFHRPPPLKSRMTSDAVFEDWFSQWTSTSSFSYAPPGYFIMQYRTGDENCMGDKLNRYTTVVWNSKRQVVPMTVDPLWRLAGVQDDGRILFVARTPDSSGCKETLVVTRIEP